MPDFWKSQAASQTRAHAEDAARSAAPAERFAAVLAEHADCTLNDGPSLGAGTTGSDVWSCGIVLPFTDDLDQAERAHVAAALAAVADDGLAERVESRARVITLCGSTRFKSEFESWNSRLTLDGNVVVSVGVFGHGYHPYHREKYLDPKKPMLDRLHLQKIDMADEVFVIDPGGYIGESTAREIEYARAHGKPVTFLSSVDPTCAQCGRDNRNGTHTALERTGHLSHAFAPSADRDERERPYCLRCEVPIYQDDQGVWRREATGSQVCPRNPAVDGHEPRPDRDERDGA